MPTKRTRRARGRQRLTLRQLGLHEMLCFGAGWRPPASEFEAGRSRWQTWEEYLSEWERVRDEVAAGSEWWFGPDFDECYAERVYRRYGTRPPPWFDGRP